MERVLQKAGETVLITPKALEVLFVLIRRNGHVVTKDELMREVWPGTFVEANNLAFNISLLRKALREGSASQGYIETVPKRGYRFIADVMELPAANSNLQPTLSSEASAPPLAGFAFRNLSQITTIVASVSLVAIVVIGIGIWVSGRFRVSEPSVRQITTNSEDDPVEHAVISPDGKYIAFGDLSGIQIQSIDTGEVHLLPRPESISSGDLWFPVAWSVDGSRIFATSITSSTTAAWNISVLNGRATLLRENASLRSVSPDGSTIAFLTSGAFHHSENAVNRHLIRGAQIYVMGPNGEDARPVLASDSSTYIGSVSWSPHGSHIAFQSFKRKGPESIVYTIETTDLKGSSPRTVFQKSHYGSFSVDHNFPNDLCWLNDGRLVYSLQEPPPKIRDSNLWTIQVDDGTGQRRGEPARLSNLAGFHMEGLSAAADGRRVLFESSTDRSYVYVARLSKDGHLVEGSRLTPNERYNTASGWTSDSRAVIFRSDRTGSFALYKQNVDSRVPELIPTGPGSPGFPRISPDGNWVIYPLGIYPKTNRLMRVPLAGGTPQVIVEQFDNSGPGDCPRRPGLPCLNFEPSSDGKQDVFFNYDPLTGSRSEAFRTARKTTSMVVSPDGSLLATIATEPAGAIEIRSRSGELKRTVRIKGWPSPVTQDWAADGKSFFVSHPGLMNSPSGPIGATVLHVDFNGHAEPIWDMRGGRYSFQIPSPDGKYIAIRGATTARNAWLLENF